MEYVGEDGRIITDEMFDAWEDHIERDGLAGTTGGELTTRREVGRPRLFDTPMVTKSFRLRIDQGEELDKFAATDHKNASELMREAWDEYADRRHELIDA